MAFQKDKYKSLIHYICRKAEPTMLGATKLNKILWYSDVLFYLKTGTPMTGEKYIKRQFGPVPKNILTILSELQADMKIVIRSCNHFGHEKREFIYLEEPDISKFSGEEIDLVNILIAEICRNHTAASISEATHDRIWELANIGEEIPYNAIFASGIGELNENDLGWAKNCLGLAA